MYRTLIVMLLCAGLFSPLSAAESPLDRLPGLTSPNGLTLGTVSGFESWRLIAAHTRIDKNELHYIWGNDEAMRAIRAAGKGDAVYGNGSIFVKMGFKMARNPLFPDSIEPSELQRVEYMIKDPKRFADTGGWGYARFPYNAAKGAFSVYGKAPDFATECYSCHLRAKKNDFVFTRHMNYLTGPNAGPASLSSSLIGGLPRWMWHPVANITAFILLICGILVARYMKRKWWWTAAHVAFQASGAVVLAAGITVMVSVIGQGRHLDVPHAYLGVVTAGCLALTASGGIVALAVRSITKTVRPVHRWAGRITVLLMFLTILGGIFTVLAGH